MHLKEGKPRTIRELGEVAENYVEAHATDIVFGIDPRQPRIRSLQSDTRRCHNCGGTGHLKHQCLKKVQAPKPPSPPRPQRVPQPSSQRKQWQTQQQRPNLRCLLCNKPGHIARNCRAKPAAAAEYYTQDGESDEAQEETAAFQPLRSAPPVRHNPLASTCNEHHRVNCTECYNSVLCRRHNKPNCTEFSDQRVSTHHCQALIAICQDCGQKHPVIADACQSRDNCHKMPVAEGTVEGESVNVLRDTGCSTVVVRRSLVPDDKLTGREEFCVLIDGTIRRTPVAEIYVDTPYYTGTTIAVCMKNPIYDLIIGNIKGAADPNPSPQLTLAVQTISQAKARKGLTPLVTPTLLSYKMMQAYAELWMPPSRRATRSSTCSTTSCTGSRRTSEAR